MMAATMLQTRGFQRQDEAAFQAGVLMTRAFFISGRCSTATGSSAAAGVPEGARTRK
jgi:hypothetical protein